MAGVHRIMERMALDNVSVPKKKRLQIQSMATALYQQLVAIGYGVSKG